MILSDARAQWDPLKLELELPAATQRFIKLDDRQQFVAPRLGQTQLRIKQFAVGVERFEQV